MASGSSDQFQSENRLKREHYLFNIASKSLKEVIRLVISRIDTFCAWNSKSGAALTPLFLCLWEGQDG